MSTKKEKNCYYNLSISKKNQIKKDYRNTLVLTKKIFKNVIKDVTKL